MRSNILISILVILGIAIPLGSMVALEPTVMLLSSFALIAALVAAFILYKPGRVLIAFLALLPVYQLTMVLILHFSRSFTLVQLLQPWKEILAIVTLLLVLYLRLLSGKLFKLHLMDWLVLLYLGLNVLYIFGPWSTSFTTRLYGVRANAFLAVLYFLGRTVKLSLHRQKQLVIGLLILGVLSGIFAIIDRFFLPPDWPNRIGLLEYLTSVSADFTQDPTQIGPMGLPWTYWTSSGIRRSSAFFANPLDLAASMHFTGVAALIVALRYPHRTNGRLLGLAIFGLIAFALLMSVSRASTIAFIIECFLISVLTRKRLFTFLMILVVALGIIAVVVSSPSIADFIIQTITFQNPSSQGHLSEWREGAGAILQNPIGFGPGSSGQVGARFGSKIGGENQYVILGVELGIPGLLLYILIQIIAIQVALDVFQRSTGVTRIIALITAVSRVGLAIVGFTAHIEIYIFTAFLSWWLLGFISQISFNYSIERSKSPLVRTVLGTSSTLNDRRS